MTRSRFVFRWFLLISLLAALLPLQGARAQEQPAETPRFVVFEAFMRPG